MLAKYMMIKSGIEKKSHLLPILSSNLFLISSNIQIKIRERARENKTLFNLNSKKTFEENIS